MFGESAKGEGVRGISHSAEHGAVVGTNDNASGVGIFGKGGRLAGQFEDNAKITGTLTIQGTNIGELAGRVQAVEGLVRRVDFRAESSYFRDPN